MNKQRENMVAPMGFSPTMTSPQRPLDPSQHQLQQMSQVAQQGIPEHPPRQETNYGQEGAYRHPDAGKPIGRPVVVPQEPAPYHPPAPAQAQQPEQQFHPRQVEATSPLQPIRAKDNFQPSETFYRKLEEERRKLAYGEELRQQMREQKERKERERRLWKFGDPKDQVNMYSSNSPGAQRHDEALLRNEYKSSFQESADAPSYLKTAHSVAAGVSQAKARAAAAAQVRSYPDRHSVGDRNAPNYGQNDRGNYPRPPARHDDAILKSEIEHSFQESEDAPNYLRASNADKRQPMVHFRSDYRDMTALENEQKQKKANELHNDLKRQMEEKKAERERERELERREEERENERIRREQEQLRKQFEGENNREHRSRRSHAAPFINLSSNDEAQGTGNPGRAQASKTPVRRSSNDNGGRRGSNENMGTMSHPSFSIPEKPRPAPVVRAPSPQPVREEKRADEMEADEMESNISLARASLSTPLVEKKIASSVESIRSELVGNQEKVIQVITEQRQALQAETESTRQEMIQMKAMLQEYQDSIQKMEQLHSEQMQMQNVYALMKQSENEDLARQSLEEGQYEPQDVERSVGAETPSWVRQAMKENGRMDLMQSLQADSTLVFPANEPVAQERPQSYRSPLKSEIMAEMPLPVVENGVVDLRLDSESNYVGQEEQWHPGPEAREPVRPLMPEGPSMAPTAPSRTPSVTSSVATLNVEELYERNADKLRMLEDLEGVDDVDEIDRKLNQFLSTSEDSLSIPLDNLNEVDYTSGKFNDDLADLNHEPERLSTPCLPAESDWIR